MDVKQTDETNQTQEAAPVKTKDGLPVNEFNQSMKPISLWDDAWRRLKKNKMALTGLFIVGFYAALSLLAPLLPIYSYSEQTIIHQNLPPSLSKAGDMMVRVLRADMMRTAKKEGRTDLSEKQKEELAALQQEVANNPVHNRRYLRYGCARTGYVCPCRIRRPHFHYDRIDRYDYLAFYRGTGRRGERLFRRLAR